MATVNPDIGPDVDLVLGTVNAPLPVAIGGAELLAVLRGTAPLEPWRTHVRSMLSDVAPEVLHSLVLHRRLSFQDLNRARIACGLHEGENADWIAEMARLELAAAAH